MTVIDNDYIKKHEPLWGSWHIDELVGEGSFGKVYKIYKEEWDYRYESALKFIRVPSKEQYKEAVMALGNDQNTLGKYFEDAARSIITEIRLMYALRGNNNIVSYEDHLVQKNGSGIGWDILIRMEFATSLNKFLAQHDLTRREVLKLGIDICSALEVCSEKNIIHRDIKDENIFVSENGRFKLGDFGISRILSKSSRIASMRGTPLYMAPEVYKGEQYDDRADIYSLGLVLYRLLNHGRLPFLPPYPQEIRFNDSEAALDKRMSGEAPTIPLQAGDIIGEIILKACSFNLVNRFALASEMRKALENAIRNIPQEYLDETIMSAKSNPIAKTEVLETVSLMPESGISDLEATEKVSQKPIVREVARTFPKEASNTSTTPPDNNMTEKIIQSKGNLNKTLSIFSQFIKPNKFTNQKGNSGGNLVNGGLAAIQGSWIYYADINHDNELFKIKTDERENTKLCSDSTWFINVVGYWIYYSNASDNDKLYKINIDGGGRTKLNDDKSWYINVVDEWIYYSNENDGYKLYKIKTDGTCRIRLNSDNSNCINVSEDWIYYSNKSDKGKLYKIRTDGSAKTKINNDDTDYINISGEWIYYINKSDGFKLYKIKTDGSGKSLICGDFTSNLNLSGEWLYYSNKNEVGKIYKIKPGGSNREKISNDNADYINIVDQFIFYSNKSDNGNLCITGIDNSKRMLTSIG